MIFYAVVEKASDSRSWYADKIGQEFPILRVYQEEVLVRTHDSYNTSNFIKATDMKWSGKEEQ